MMLTVVDALAQHVDDAVTGDLALEPGEELVPGRGRLS
jgi:hypothetical protein